ncbi:WG repeat-containing protein [Flavobacterium sp. SM2513]|uniref:WG repeat-containing protein n=1 Tax=Flavobacterium sp. SM2513 TaxID=3424766 RepID=UPI003D7FC712
MNWNDIKVSDDTTHFIYEGNMIFDSYFLEVLKFHAPGLAPVLDQSGAFHIDSNGNDLYEERYDRTFGFYCNRAAVMTTEGWFHVNEKGDRLYQNNYAWAGNFQEHVCAVRDMVNSYFHIDLNGDRCYNENYRYAGDFKDRIACVQLENGRFKHIDTDGAFINSSAFLDLGVYHKNFATAKDEEGWFHIDKQGLALYKERYLLIEPYYNGFALVTKFNTDKQIIDERGVAILAL